MIPSQAIYNNVQHLFVNNYLSSDHWTILFKFSTNINKSISPRIKVKLLHKTYWKSINSSLSNQSAILQSQISNILSSGNLDPITITSNAANILTDIIADIRNHLAKASLNPNTSISLTIQLLIKQEQRKNKTAFVKSRNAFIKPALNAIS